MSAPNTITATLDDDTLLFATHYAELLPEFMQVGVADIQCVNLDVTSIVATMLGTHATIPAMIDQIQHEAPLIDVERIQRLDAYAMALRHAHTLYLLANTPPARLRPLVESGTELRALLLRDATDLVRRRRIRSARLDELLGPIGYKNLASDLLVLAALFRQHFPQISGKCQTSPGDIQRADAIAAEILRAVGRKDQRRTLIAETSDIRNRAFTVATGVYDQLRRAVVFLRWHEQDADSIAPSLFIKRHQRKRSPRVVVSADAQPRDVSPTPTTATTATSVAVAEDPFLT